MSRKSFGLFAFALLAGACAQSGSTADGQAIAAATSSSSIVGTTLGEGQSGGFDAGDGRGEAVDAEFCRSKEHAERLATADFVESDISPHADRAGLVVGSPAIWQQVPRAVVKQMGRPSAGVELLVFVDPEPLTSPSPTFWVRAFNVGTGDEEIWTEVVFDGACGESGGGVLSQIVSCEVSTPSSASEWPSITWTVTRGEGLPVILSSEMSEILRRGEPNQLGPLTAQIVTRLGQHGETLEDNVSMGIHTAFGAGTGLIEYSAGVIARRPSADQEEVERDEIVACGSVEVPALFSSPDCAVSLTPLPEISLTTEATPSLDLQVLRNGEPVNEGPIFPGRPFVDTGAPTGMELVYQVLDTSDRADGVPSECGTVTLDQAPSDIQRLRSIESIPLRFGGTYFYTTVRPLCAGCEFEGTTVQISFAGFGTSGFEHELVSAVTLDGQDIPAAQPWIVHPEGIPSRLIAAIEAGRNVEITYTPGGGDIARWTIDGIGSEVLCTEGDTAGPNMRQPVCGNGY